MVTGNDANANPGRQNDPAESQATEGSYYWSGGKRYYIVADPELIAMRMKPSRKTLSLRAQGLLQDATEATLFIPEYGVQISKISPERAALHALTGEHELAGSEDGRPELMRANVARQTTRMLNEESAVDFASPVYTRTPGSSQIIVPTRDLLVQFKPEVTSREIDALNAQYGVEIVEPLDYAQNGYLLSLSPENSDQNSIAVANAYYESGLTIFSHPDLIQQRFTKARSAIVSRRRIAAGRAGTSANTGGIYLGRQWHLEVSRVRDAWQITRGDRAINIAILDDGVDIAHPEFASKVTDTYDFARNNSTLQLGLGDNHGTACAGVATAAGNKASGVAPMCGLLAVRTPRFLGSADEARMFTWAADNGADVISCSWGPPDGTSQEEPLPDNVRQAIHECVRYGGRGRKGKGIPIFWAAGNGSESVSLDGYASNPDVIAVAASTSREKIAWYSDSGKEISICAPSSGDPGQDELGVFTVDRLGPSGYNSGSAALGDINGDYVNDFGGTSAAAPLAAGVAALMLSVEPGLTAAQVRDILQQTADKIGDSQNYDVGGFSPQYGYGRVNALRAVQTLLPPAQSSSGAIITTNPVVARSANTLNFRLRLPMDKYYAVELANSADLLEGNSSNRTGSNYYASWIDNGLLTTAAYSLPETIWAQLRTANKLYYRLWLSDAVERWVNPQALPQKGNASEIPFVTIMEPRNQHESPVLKRLELQERTSTRSAAEKIRRGEEVPFIAGPQLYSRISEPPTFTIMPGRHSYWAVEIATDPQLFDDERDALDRNSANYFTSLDYGMEYCERNRGTYMLPAEKWMGLRRSARLYYRLITFPSASLSRPEANYSPFQERHVIELHNPNN